MRRREILVRTYEESARPDTLILPDLSPINALKDQALSIEDCVCEICLGAARAQLMANDPVSMPLTSAAPSVTFGPLHRGSGLLSNGVGARAVR